MSKVFDVLRWIALIPAVFLTWYLFLRIIGPIPHMMIMWGFAKTWSYLEPIMPFVAGILLCILTYFVGKWVAPNHKKVAGWCALALPPLYLLVLWLYTVLH